MRFIGSDAVCLLKLSDGSQCISDSYFALIATINELKILNNKFDIQHTTFHVKYAHTDAIRATLQPPLQGFNAGTSSSDFLISAVLDITKEAGARAGSMLRRNKGGS